MPKSFGEISSCLRPQVHPKHQADLKLEDFLTHDQLLHLRVAKTNFMIELEMCFFLSKVGIQHCKKQSEYRNKILHFALEATSETILDLLGKLEKQLKHKLQGGLHFMPHHSSHRFLGGKHFTDTDFQLFELIFPFVGFCVTRQEREERFPTLTAFCKSCVKLIQNEKLMKQKDLDVEDMDHDGKEKKVMVTDQIKDEKINVKGFGHMLGEEREGNQIDCYPSYLLARKRAENLKSVNHEYNLSKSKKAAHDKKPEVAKQDSTNTQFEDAEDNDEKAKPANTPSQALSYKFADLKQKYDENSEMTTDERISFVNELLQKADAEPIAQENIFKHPKAATIPHLLTALKNLTFTGSTTDTNAAGVPVSDNDLVLKNLFLRGKEKSGGGIKYFLLSVPHNKKVDYKKITKELGDFRGDLRQAKAEDLDSILKVKPGDLSPFSLFIDGAQNVTFVMAKDTEAASLKAKEGKIVVHPLTNEASVRIGGEQLEKFLTACGKKPVVLEFEDAS